MRVQRSLRAQESQLLAVHSTKFALHSYSALRCSTGFTDFLAWFTFFMSSENNYKNKRTCLPPCSETYLSFSLCSHCAHARLFEQKNGAKCQFKPFWSQWKAMWLELASSSPRGCWVSCISDVQAFCRSGLKSQHYILWTEQVTPQVKKGWRCGHSHGKQVYTVQVEQPTSPIKRQFKGVHLTACSTWTPGQRLLSYFSSSFFFFCLGYRKRLHLSLAHRWQRCEFLRLNFILILKFYEA